MKTLSEVSHCKAVCVTLRESTTLKSGLLAMHTAVSGGAFGERPIDRKVRH